MSEMLRAGIVRIFREADQQVVGVGFLVDVEKKTILTCAHVINVAIGKPDNQDKPRSLISLDVPFLDPKKQLDARVTHFFPKKPDNTDDIALLEILDELPVGANAVEFAAADAYGGHEFGVYGFPVGYEEDGQYVEGRLQEKLVNKRIQAIGTSNLGYFVESGFSGSPVYDKDLDAVAGMMMQVDVESKKRIAFVCPSNVIITYIKKGPVNTIRILEGDSPTSQNAEPQFSKKDNSLKFDFLSLDLEWCHVPSRFSTANISRVEGSSPHSEWGGKRGGYTEYGNTYRVTTEFPAFYIGRFPITNMTYRIFLESGFLDSYIKTLSSVKELSHLKSGSMLSSNEGDDLPRSNVSWYEAVIFCSWLNAEVNTIDESSSDTAKFRLPTKDEWMFACLGTDYVSLKAYASASKLFNFKEKRLFGKSPVVASQEAPSAFGAIDLVGNVFELCLNETQIIFGRRRWAVGGSWKTSRNNGLVRKVSPSERNDDVGFRVIFGSPPKGNVVKEEHVGTYSHDVYPGEVNL